MNLEEYIKDALDNINMVELRKYVKDTYNEKYYESVVLMELYAEEFCLGVGNNWKTSWEEEYENNRF